MFILLSGGGAIASYSSSPFQEDEHNIYAQGIIYPKTNDFSVVEVVSLPDNFSVDKYEYVSGSLVEKVLSVDDESRLRFLSKIDFDTDSTIFGVIGNRVTEYQTAYHDASTFANAGYPSNDIPQSVKDWASIKGWTVQEAADNVVETGDAWTAAKDFLRKTRLTYKEKARTVTTIDDLQRAEIEWYGIMAALKVQLRIG